jgi:hypothetical protein
MNAERCKQICKDVWRDRASILTGHTDANGETALLQAVYWRLCKTGDDPDQSIADTPFLKELVQQYRDETAKS